MKYLIVLLSILSIGSILIGYFAGFQNSEKFIGFGVLGLFFIVFPLFSYHRWKNKDVKDYMLTKENLDKMRDSEKHTRK
jgi:membrane protein YdbS with pleckstrin-like domain